MNLLDVVKAFTARSSLQIPTYALGNPDPQIRQIVGIMNEFLEDLQIRKVWQQNSVEILHTALGQEDQGAIRTLCPYGFEGILFNTLWNRTLRWKVKGGMPAAEWQERKALGFTGALYQFRLRRGRMLMMPQPQAGHLIAWEYFSSWFVQSPAGIYQQYWLTDADTCVLDDSLMTAWLTWAWAKKKGFEYAEDFRKYELLIATKGSRDSSPKAIRLDGYPLDNRCRSVFVGTIGGGGLGSGGLVQQEDGSFVALEGS